MKPIIKRTRSWLTKNAREKRASVFRGAFCLDENTKILDLGGGAGLNIHSVLKGSPVKPENVYVADIKIKKLTKGKIAFGYNPVLVTESDRLPFDDIFFDIVYCSSVIEHVTVPKNQVWSLYSGSEFKKRSLARQKEFSREIQRVGKHYFVQTPYKHFPIESHSWLPFIAWLPRRLLIPVLKFTNLFWIKKTKPDWYLLNRAEMSKLFDGADMFDETSFGLTKSIMAIK